MVRLHSLGCYCFASASESLAAVDFNGWHWPVYARLHSRSALALWPKADSEHNRLLESTTNNKTHRDTDTQTHRHTYTRSGSFSSCSCAPSPSIGANLDVLLLQHFCARTRVFAIAEESGLPSASLPPSLLLRLVVLVSSLPTPFLAHRQASSQPQPSLVHQLHACRCPSLGLVIASLLTLARALLPHSFPCYPVHLVFLGLLLHRHRCLPRPSLWSCACSLSKPR